MMSQLTRLRDEALRLLTVYEEYKDSDDLSLRRKAHLDVDKFLMEHRDTAMILLVRGLQEEIDNIVVTQKLEEDARKPWWRKLGGKKDAKDSDRRDKKAMRNERSSIPVAKVDETQAT